jgi:Flp pilus assembly protein TadG
MPDQRGQGLAIFVLSIFVLVGLCAIVVDVSWYWSNSLRVQRAADAAALAGAVDLPHNPGTISSHLLGTGIGDALAEAAKDGYTNGIAGVAVTPAQDSVAKTGGNDNQMDVTISAPVPTFFMRIFGIQTITATRSSEAMFTLPVPMGSPQNYYGDFGLVRDATFTNTTTGNMTTTSNLLQGPGTLCSAVTTGAPSDCYQPNGAALTPTLFWGAMNTKGIGSDEGDAFQSDKDPTGATAPNCSTVSGLRSCYDPTDYYNYAIDMPAGSSGGYVYIFDPVFCETAFAEGTGDGLSSGSLDPSNPPSSWYELWDTNNTPYDLTDDTLLVTSGTKFRDMPYSDTTMGGSGGSQCKQTSTAYGDPRDYHDNWYLLNPTTPLSGGTEGHVYRLHTTNSTPAGQSDSVNQSNVATEQNFAIFASATGGTPSVYGLGAMEMYTPISISSGSQTSQFYLAQVPVYYAGKTLELNLWDPGDVGSLTAKLYVAQPTSTVGTWAPVNFNYTVGSAAGDCYGSPSSGANVAYVQTNSFNACWLTVDVGIPSTYTAPQNGWWQVWYAMTGNGESSDTTTWTAQIKGNPVHLVVP